MGEMLETIQDILLENYFPQSKCKQYFQQLQNCQLISSFEFFPQESLLDYWNEMYKMYVGVMMILLSVFSFIVVMGQSIICTRDETRDLIKSRIESPSPG